MSEKISMIDSAQDFKVYFKFKAPLANSEDINILVGNLADYKYKGQRAGAPKWAMGMGRDPIAFNRGIEKIEGQCIFNVLSVDFESDFAYLLNALKSIYSKLKDGAKSFINSVFAEIYRRRNPGKSLVALEDIKDITPKEVTLDLIPEFTIVVQGDNAKEVIEGVQFFAKDGSVGVSTIGINSSYQFTARNVIPLEKITKS